MEPKTVSGGILRISRKVCGGCHRPITIGTTRYTCVPCKQHFCLSCASNLISRSTAGGGSGTSPFPSAVTGSGSVPSSSPPRRALEREDSKDLKDTREACKFGAGCYNHSPEHRKRYSHPEIEEGHPGMRLACKYGEDCYRKDPTHREQFVHPGDRNYRTGLVHFKAGQKPHFRSLLDIFQFYDPDESGHLSKEEFSETLSGMAEHLHVRHTPVDKAWEDAGGPHTGYMNFRMFASWTQDHLGLDMPMGLDPQSTSRRKCRFRLNKAKGETGERCSCEGHDPVDSSDNACCKCGHKSSMHRSDMAQRSYSAFLHDTAVPNWVEGKVGLVRIHDTTHLDALQALLSFSHKSTDNWTRDRGCKLHGVNGCGVACASRNRVAVPTGYQLVSAYRNQNQDLWMKYTIARSAIAEECSRPCRDVHEPRGVSTTGREIDSDLNCAANEWHLFHGTDPARCKGICSTNFRLAMAGTGATWKDAGKSTGTPLYGFGVYFAERITKADEYSAKLPPEREQAPPIIERNGDDDLYTVLLCRVIGGRTKYITTNEIEVDKLKKDVFEGSYNSVFGDREVSLGKPFREIVVYDKDQCYPEFLLTYRRLYS